MTEYLIVGVGGALGSVTRYILGKQISARSSSKFPLGTFIINISGALLLGIVISMGISGNQYLLFVDGFLGAYTTFSTFMYEGFRLFAKKDKLNALTYIIGSIVLGFSGIASGIRITKIF
jgi:CrcB protein